MSGGRQPNPLRGVLRDFILGGGVPKEFAFHHGVQIACVGKMLNNLGLRKYYLAPEEYRRVLADRAAQRRDAA